MRLITMHRDRQSRYIEGADPKYPIIPLWLNLQEIECLGDPFFKHTPENRVPKHKPLVIHSLT